ncbi:hypothetical protein EZV62_017593 [Acer yangbiense]|uniref:RNase H type-1 domain-containing protein n=1 Tax=Acer yangbiense TaxID=1000413 RepID=A0A5C7HGT2_9ROSI|nr:hypothetical protein EZV62_017593 [Acer yangbiense]
MIESDAEVIVGWINSRKHLASEIGLYIDDIHGLLCQSRCVAVSFVPRLANQVAHMLARNGLSCVENMFWLEDSPPFVCSFLAVDRRGWRAVGFSVANESGLPPPHGHTNLQGGGGSSPIPTALKLKPLEEA